MKNKVALFIATWFYSGMIPPIFGKSMGGTYGSIFSIPLCYLALLAPYHGIGYCIIMLVIFAFGLWAVPRAEIVLGETIDHRGRKRFHDQNQIVIDEVLGMLTSCLPLVFFKVEMLWLALLLAFGFFRFFDIAKIPPIRFFDRMQSASGVMLDDFVAGVYSALVLILAIKLGLCGPVI
jgi:phosphatidylglycerophosphatase A